MEQKTIKMNEEKEQKDVTKISYEELEKIANQLAASNRELYKKLAAMNTELTFATLDYCTRVCEINQKDEKFSKEFMNKIYSTIENTMTDLINYISPKEKEDKKDATN